MRISCLRNVLKVGAIWFINDEFIGKKLRWVISPPPKKNFGAPSSETTGRTQKVRWAQKWYGHALSTCQVWWRSAASRWREEKIGVFCLFVTLTVCVSLGYRCTHCEAYIVAIYRLILMQFSAFLEEETPCRILQKYLNCITRWRQICLVLGLNSEIFQNSNAKFLRTTSTIYEKDRKNSTAAY